MKNNRFWFGILAILLISGMLFYGCDLPSADDVGDFELLHGTSEPYAPNSLFFKTGSGTWREESYEGVLAYTFKFSSGTKNKGVNGIIIHRTPDDGVRFFVPIIGEKNTDFLYKMNESDNWIKYGIVVHK